MVYRALRALYRFSKYEETRPLRWEAFGIQLARDAAVWGFYIVTAPIWVPYVTLLLVTYPFWLFHEYVERKDPLGRLSEPVLGPVGTWWKKHVERLNPIYLNAARKAGD